MKAIFRIIWSRRLIVLVAVAACMLGGVYVLETAAPRYKASARVVLDIIKPDPVTGFVVDSKQVDTYIKSQIRVIGDYQVAASVVQNLGLLDDPDLQAAYAARPPSDTRPFVEWISQRLIGRTQIAPVPETNILEISYWGDAPESARVIAEALRDAYVDAQTFRLREGARENADALDKQAALTRQALEAAEARKANLERETGVMITDAGSDLENKSVSSLQSTETNLSLAGPKAVESYGPAERRLLQLDMTIAAAGAALGPNNPQLLALMRARAAAASSTANERAAMGTRGLTASELVSQGLSASISKVISNRVEVTRVRMLQDEVKQRRQDYDKLVEASGKAREISRAAQANVIPLVGSTVPRRPEFPKPELILGGTFALGLLVGGMVALLTEMFDRRIRSSEDLALAAPGVILVTVPRAKTLKRPSRRRSWAARRATLAVAPAE